MIDTRPLIGLVAGGRGRECRLCDRPADIVNRPGGELSDEYAYCVYCATAALERFDLAKGRG